LTFLEYRGFPVDSGLEDSNDKKRRKETETIAEEEKSQKCEKRHQ
jgi:hypothetical protein